MAGWNIATPADTDLVRNYPALYRTDKTTLRDQLFKEHDMLDAAGTATGRHKFPIGTTAQRPTGIVPGSVFFNYELMKFEIQLADGQWFTVVGEGDKVPVGSILAYATQGPSPPASGWLYCDGNAYSRTTYAALFTQIGTYWGSGDGVNTFNVPDLRGRVTVGVQAGTAEFGVMGQTGGAVKVGLLVDEMPQHQHVVYDNGHSHQENYALGGVDQSNGNIITAGRRPTSDKVGVTQIHLSNIGMGPVGLGVPHLNLQPYVVVGFIIRY